MTKAEKQREKLDALIQKGQEKAKTVIETVMNTKISDRIVKTSALQFYAYELVKDSYTVGLQVGKEKLAIHRHALQQATAKVDMPWSFTDRLEQSRKEWANKLLAHNLNTLYEQETGKYLIRSVDEQLLGFLSERYRRLDTGPLLESFAAACSDRGALPYDGYAMDTKIAVQAIVPRIYEPVPGETMAYGVSYEDSAFGNGPTKVSIFALRTDNLNGFIASKALRQIHLGRQIPDDEIFAQDTYEADTKALALKVRDVVKGRLSDAAIEAVQDAIKAAYEDKMGPKSLQDYLKKNLSKDVAKQITDTFNSPDVENLPPGNTKWRLANALSWVGMKTEDPEEKLELQRLAGDLLNVTL